MKCTPDSSGNLSSSNDTSSFPALNFRIRQTSVAPEDQYIDLIRYELPLSEMMRATSNILDIHTSQKDDHSLTPRQIIALTEAHSSWAGVRVFYSSQEQHIVRAFNRHATRIDGGKVNDSVDYRELLKGAIRPYRRKVGTAHFHLADTLRHLSKAGFGPHNYRTVTDLKRSA